MRKYFIDMDGVIVVYDHSAYDRTKGPLPGVALFEHEPARYFRHCKPDPNGIALLRRLSAEPDSAAYVLTCVDWRLPGAVRDKTEWLREHCPFLDVGSRLLIARHSKVGEAKAVLGVPRLDDDAILIDDFNRNLEFWNESGGRAVKYLNGLNDPNSWHGETISPENIDTFK